VADQPDYLARANIKVDPVKREPRIERHADPTHRE
jgi:hypothetical protein